MTDAIYHLTSSFSKLTRFTPAFQHHHFCVSQVISVVTGSYSDRALSPVIKQIHNKHLASPHKL